MEIEGIFFALLGAAIIGQPQNIPSRIVAAVILLSGVIGALRSSMAYVIHLRPDELIAKSFYRTRRFKYRGIRRVESSAGQVGLYTRTYLRLVLVQGSSYDFEALNDGPRKPATVEAAVAAVNARIQSHGAVTEVPR